MNPSEKAARDAIRRRSISSQISHLWSDTLFAREQARKCIKRQAPVRSNLKSVQKDAAIAKLHGPRYEAELRQLAWNLGSYVRWTVVTGWMAFERSAIDATGKKDLSQNIQQNLPREIAAGMPPNKFWATSPWSGVQTVRKQRNKIIHKTLGSADLFADLKIAEDSVVQLRQGIVEMFSKAGKSCPLWVECDEVPRQLGGSFANVTTIRGKAEEDSDRYRICWVQAGTEFNSAVIPSTDDPWAEVRQLATHLFVPAEAIRIYKGEKLLEELDFKMRGS